MEEAGGRRRRRQRWADRAALSVGAAVAAAAGVLALALLGAAAVRRATRGGGVEVRGGGAWRGAELRDASLLGPAHPLAEGGCAIDRVDAQALGGSGGFARAFQGRQPVVASGLAGNLAFARATERAELERLAGSEVVLRASDTFSQGRHTASFGDYLAGMAQTGSQSARGGDARKSLYLFGPVGEIGEAFGGVLSEYAPPPFAERDAAQSLSVGPSGSGVPFHVHGDGWCEVAHGRKLWLLAPPWAKPEFDPVQPALEWVRERYAAAKGALGDELLACVIGKGEALYFPQGWWHLVLNIGEVVAVSSFNPPPPPGAGSGSSTGAPGFGAAPDLK